MAIVVSLLLMLAFACSSCVLCQGVRRHDDSMTTLGVVLILATAVCGLVVVRTHSWFDSTPTATKPCHWPREADHVLPPRTYPMDPKTYMFVVRNAYLNGYLDALDKCDLGPLLKHKSLESVPTTDHGNAARSQNPSPIGGNH